MNNRGPELRHMVPPYLDYRCSKVPKHHANIIAETRCAALNKGTLISKVYWVCCFRLESLHAASVLCVFRIMLCVTCNPLQDQSLLRILSRLDKYYVTPYPHRCRITSRLSGSVDDDGSIISRGFGPLIKLDHMSKIYPVYIYIYVVCKPYIRNCIDLGFEFS